MSKGLSILSASIALMISFNLAHWDGLLLWICAGFAEVFAVLAYAVFSVPSEKPKTVLTNWAALIHEASELSTIVRRDGLIQAEAYGKKLADLNFQKCFKWIAEGHEARLPLEWIKINAEKDAEVYNTWCDWGSSMSAAMFTLSILVCLPVLSSGASKIAAPIFIGLLASILTELILVRRLKTQNQDQAQYWESLSIAVKGIAEGVHASLLEAKLTARTGTQVRT